MYDDTTRLHIARDVATAVICNGIDPSELAIKMMCGCGTLLEGGRPGELRAEQGRRHRQEKGGLRPGQLNGDFRQMFDRGRSALPAHGQGCHGRGGAGAEREAAAPAEGLEIATKYAAMM